MKNRFLYKYFRNILDKKNFKIILSLKSGSQNTLETDDSYKMLIHYYCDDCLLVVGIPLPNLTSFISSEPFLGWSFSMKFNLAKTEAIICPVNGYWNSKVFCKTRNNNTYTFIKRENLRNSKIRRMFIKSCKKAKRSRTESAGL